MAGVVPWTRRTRRSWECMLARCLNQRNRDYPRYGGRGIAVCETWRNSFRSFLRDMGERPEGTSLDRINNDGNYEPSNCRWATPKEQRRNNSQVHLLTCQGESLTLAEWGRRVGMDPGAIRGRLKRGLTPEEALTLPKQPRKKWRLEASRG